MQFYDAIEEMIRNAGRSVYSVQKELGKSNIINSSKSRGSVLQTNTVSRIASACGYKIALVPRESMTDACIAIEPNQKGE